MIHQVGPGCIVCSCYRSDDPSSRPWLQNSAAQKPSAKHGGNVDVTPRGVFHAPDIRQKTKTPHEPAERFQADETHPPKQPEQKTSPRPHRPEADKHHKQIRERKDTKKAIYQNNKQTSKKHKSDSNQKTKKTKEKDSNSDTDSDSSSSNDDEKLFSFVKRKTVVLPESLKDNKRNQLSKQHVNDGQEGKEGKDGLSKHYTTRDAVNVYCADYLRAKSKYSSSDAKSSKRADDTPRAPADDPHTDAKRHIPPWHRKEYVLNRRETNMYQHISKVYSSDKIKKNRQNQFYKKLLELQLEHWRQEHDAHHRKHQKCHEQQLQQQKQLKRLRNKSVTHILGRLLCYNLVYPY